MPDIRLRNHVCDNNKQNRFNGEFVGLFESAHGLKKERCLVFRIAILCHNHIKPDSDIGNTEDVDVCIQGYDTLQIRIQNVTVTAGYVKMSIRHL